jgi:hypothetical protein
MSTQTELARTILSSKDLTHRRKDRSNSDRVKVCISMITRGSMLAATSEWILQACAELFPDVEVHYVIDGHPVDHMRNLQVKRFLESDCTHLFTIDSDCVPQNETIQKLLERNLPIVVAPTPAYIDNKLGLLVGDRNTNADYKKGEPLYRQHQPLTGLQECDAVGGSGLLIKREVFEAIKPPYFKFEYDDDGYSVLSEDLYFCNKVRAAGYKIYADCDLVQSHIKELDLVSFMK